MANLVRPSLDDAYLNGLPRADDYDDDAAPHPLFTEVEDEKARFLHPQAKKMFDTCPWTRKIPLFGEASEGYGPLVCVSLGASYLLCKGIADQTLRGATFSMLVTRFGISAQRYQRLSPISGMGWSIKAFTAALCDSFAFLGYTKRWYMFISCVLGAVFALVYGLLPAQESSANIAVALIFLTSYGKANVDILSEGHYSRLIRKHPEQGPALVSFIWWWIMLGTLISSCIYGPLADAGKQQNGIFVSAALQFVTGIIYLFNWYGEEINRVERAEDAKLLRDDFIAERAKARLMVANIDEDGEGGLRLPHEDGLDGGGAGKDMHPELYENDFQNNNDSGALHDSIDEYDNVEPTGKVCMDGVLSVEAGAPYDDLADYEVPQPTPCFFGIFEFNKEVAQRNWKVFVYSGVMTCAVIAMTCGSILADTLGMLLICVIVSVICCCTSFWALPLIIAKANVFGYLQEATYLQMSVTDSFFLAKPDCLPNGPHFSFTFYNTVANVIGGVAGILAVTVFNYIFAKHSYRLAFIATTIIRVVSGFFDIVIVKRWNEDVGMPDHAMYLCGDTIIGQVCYMLNWMPMVILLSRLCPRGSESVVYALMAGFSNLGQSTSAQIASAIMEWDFPVDSTVTPCTGFEDNLPWLLFIGHICTPLIAIPLTLLVPACRICDNIDLEGNLASAIAGTTDPVASAGFEDRTADPYGHHGTEKLSSDDLANNTSAAAAPNRRTTYSPRGEHGDNQRE